MRRTVNGYVFQLVGVHRYDVPAFTHVVSSMPPLHQMLIATYGEHDTAPTELHNPAQGRCLERNALPDLRYRSEDALALSWAHLDTQIHESQMYRDAPFRARQQYKPSQGTRSRLANSWKLAGSQTGGATGYRPVGSRQIQLSIN